MRLRNHPDGDLPNSRVTRQSAGATVFVPAGAERGVEATTRLALLAVRVAD